MDCESPAGAGAAAALGGRNSVDGGNAGIGATCMLRVRGKLSFGKTLDFFLGCGMAAGGNAGRVSLNDSRGCLAASAAALAASSLFSISFHSSMFDMRYFMNT